MTWHVIPVLRYQEQGSLSLRRIRLDRAVDSNHHGSLLDVSRCVVPSHQAAFGRGALCMSEAKTQALVGPSGSMWIMKTGWQG